METLICKKVLFFVIGNCGVGGLHHDITGSDDDIAALHRGVVMWSLGPETAFWACQGRCCWKKAHTK